MKVESADNYINRPESVGFRGLEVEEFAGILYTRYCEEVGGKGFDGSPLPTWREFASEPAKAAQFQAWVQVARLAYLLSQ